ncbi:membrane protein YeiH [Desulfocucumis palustris]|uniref:Membrane protein YeiH n=1 Tax=Desulfocucumis palustris TaxID=1898651 RepID=A0A2L2XAI5_9FIRM|nr:putative sulfate exporter family transporter [Desulfocucumis palustris]GBF33287.1 membrane protein YeiH [Desulfocucumis palustris]
MLVQGFRLVLKLVPGILVMLAVALLARGGADLGFPQWRGLEALFASNPVTSKLLIDILHLNYILISILAGMLFRNLIGLPDVLKPGIRTSRLFIKIGVILLGSLYSVADLASLGLNAFIIIFVFIALIIAFTLYLGQKIGMNRASASILAAGTAVCGVSAIVATAPAVRAKTSDVAYSIATILSVGVIFLLVFPPIGTLIGLTAHQFGVWAGTGILNSGQVLAAALAFDHGTADRVSESLKTGEIFNLARIIFLPFVVLALAVYNSRGEDNDDEYPAYTGFWDKFPLFIIGFFVVVIMTSFGLLGETSPPSPGIVLIRNLYNWFFAIGLSGLGMQISFEELRKAGGQPLLVGTAAAVLKALLALIVTLLFIPARP